MLIYVTIMPAFEHLDPNDMETVARILARSTEMLIMNPDVRVGVPLAGDTLDEDRLGISGYCMESSDAVTRAAHSLGIVAAREPLVGWHFITTFAPLDQMPSPDDLVLCRTWGQYDNDLYASDHPLAGRPFFGPRKDLADLLPGSQGRFEPDSVMFRQVVHKPGRTALRRHVWLATDPDELVRTNFVMGQSEMPVPDADSHWL
jgi:hypothetical protein